MIDHRQHARVHVIISFAIVWGLILVAISEYLHDGDRFARGALLVGIPYAILGMFAAVVHSLWAIVDHLVEIRDALHNERTAR